MKKLIESGADSTPLGEHIYNTLIAELREGKYLPGQRLRDREIAEAFGVSRTPAREAMWRLHSRGLLEVAQGGLAVRKLAPAEIIELYSVRQVLEGSSARFAAQHCSNAEIYVIEQIAAAFGEAAGDPQLRRKINRQFHMAIREGAHNRVLIRTLDEFDIALAILPGTTYESPERAEQAHQEHLAIIAAIKARDPEAAEAAARQHIANAQQARLTHLFSRSSFAADWSVNRPSSGAA